MKINGILVALGAGLFFGVIGPLTKNAYNFGAGVGLAIFLRYLVALIIVSPIILKQKNLQFLQDLTHCRILLKVYGI